MRIRFVRGSQFGGVANLVKCLRKQSILRIYPSDAEQLRMVLEGKGATQSDWFPECECTEQNPARTFIVV